MSFYTTGDIEKKLHIKRNRLKEWIDRGYITPTRQEKTGTGMMSLFDTWGLYCIMMFSHLLTDGFSRKQAAKMVLIIYTFSPKKTLPPIFVIKNPSQKNISISCPEAEMLLFDNPDISGYILNFEALQKQVDIMLGLKNFHRGLPDECFRG